MRMNFYNALANLGYKTDDPDKEASYNGNTVNILFDIPKVQQSQSRIDNTAEVQTQNGNFVTDYQTIKNYLGISSNDPNLIQESAIQAASNEVKDAYNRIKDYYNSILSIFN